MLKCKECGSDQFSFKRDGEMTVARCRNCQEEIRFKGKTKVKYACKKCGATAKKVTHDATKEDLHKRFYYENYLVCTKCEFKEPIMESKITNF